jgi:hypothetical protein
MSKPKNSKPLLLSYTDHRHCRCGADYDVTDSLDLDTGQYTGNLHECPRCGSPYDYIVTGTTFYDVVHRYLAGLEDMEEGDMLSKKTSVRRARKVLGKYDRKL